MPNIRPDWRLVQSKVSRPTLPPDDSSVSSDKVEFNSLEDVEKTFKSWDLNGDGAISFTELQVFILIRSSKV